MAAIKTFILAIVLVALAATAGLAQNPGPGPGVYVPPAHGGSGTVSAVSAGTNPGQPAVTITNPTTTPSITVSNSPNIAGNNLTNFLNASLVHTGGATVVGGTAGAHKTIFIIGNSTVWNASAYFSEMCNRISSNQNLIQSGITPCTTGAAISGYQIFDNAGHVEITFASTPPAYAVGDAILSQPTNAGLAAGLSGTGIVTANPGVGGADTIDYTILASNALPSTTAFTASTGVTTNSLANLGSNGATSGGILTTDVPFVGTYSLPGDLVMVRGPIINDVRLGACNLACATANVSALYNAIVAAIPAKADIGWKDENSLLTTDPTSSGYVSPLASSAAYTQILHDAVFAALSPVPSRPVVWDNMQLVYTKLGFERATTTWMADILHPASLGQRAEANDDFDIWTNLNAGKGIFQAPASDPYVATGTNNLALSGSKASFFANLKTLIGYSPYLADHALADNYTTPWTLYPDVVLDTEKFDIVAYGVVTAASSTVITFTYPTPVGSSGNLFETRAGDLIWVQGYGIVGGQMTANGLTTFVTSGTVNQATINAGITGVPTILGTPYVAVMRQKSYNLGDVGYLTDTNTYRARHVTIAGGTNFFFLTYNDTPPSTQSWPSAISATDYISGTCINTILTGATFQVHSAGAAQNIQVNLTGTWTGCTGASSAGILYSKNEPDAEYTVVNSKQGIWVNGVPFGVAGPGTLSITGGGALATGSYSSIGTVTGAAATLNKVTTGMTCPNITVVQLDDETTVGGATRTAADTVSFTFSATAADTVDYFASCR